jgi:hypothetical protein
MALLTSFYFTSESYSYLECELVCEEATQMTQYQLIRSQLRHGFQFQRQKIGWVRLLCYKNQKIQIFKAFSILLNSNRVETQGC